MPITVSTPYLRVLLEGARTAGVSFEDLVDQLQCREALDDLEGRIEQANAHQLWERIARRSGDAAFGLHVAEAIRPGAFAVLDYAARNAPTLGEAYRRIVRYSRLIHDGAQVQLSLDDEHARLSYTLPGYPGGSPRHTAEFIVAIWVVTGRQMTETDFTPLSVCFQHPQPADTDEHRRLFRCSIAFDASANEMCFNRALMSRALAQADPQLSLLLDRYADELLARLPSGEDFAGTVRRHLAAALRGGDPGLEAIARKLRMSPRTLQRRLKDEGTSHQDLLDDLRRELAQKYLREPTVAISEAAFLLGFSEPSAFHRAFKRWTGTTPGEFRRHLAMH